MLRAIAFILLGGTLMIAAGVSAAGVVRFLRTAARATGTVVALNAGGSHPQIVFTTDTGVSVEYPQGGLVFGRRVGEQVSVRYQTADPRGTATLDTFLSLWTVPLIVGILAIFALAAGATSLPAARSHDVGVR
jgi:hypothetical protein